MSAVGVIPARYASSRLPGKPLAPIAGRPMIEHVWRRSLAARSLRDVIVATDDPRIADVCRAFGAPVAMTRDDHESGTDRIGEVAQGLDDEIIVNIQGDEPLIEAQVIDRLVAQLQGDAEAGLATVSHPLEDGALDDPNRVKVQTDPSGRALAFSRSPLPGAAQHAGLYAFRRSFLLQFIALPPSPGERSERLEQLRAMDNGHAILVAHVADWCSVPVDVAADIARVEARLAAGLEADPAATQQGATR